MCAYNTLWGGGGEGETEEEEEIVPGRRAEGVADRLAQRPENKRSRDVTCVTCVTV